MEANKNKPVEIGPRPVPATYPIRCANEMTGDLLGSTEELPPLSMVKPFTLFPPRIIRELIELYHMKYREMENKTVGQIRAMDVWNGISKKMKEKNVYLFTAKEVKEKFTEVRKDYFKIKNMIDVEHFQYFAQMHDVYHDELIDAIKHKKPMPNELQRRSKPRDEALWSVDTNTEEIGLLHKEPDFQDIVAKELQGIQESEALNEQNSNSAKKHESDNKSKRLKKEAPPNQDDKPDGYVVVQTPAELKKEMGATLPDISEMGTLDTASNDCKDMTLAEYNAEQERRHLEKMKSLEKSLEMQDRAIAMQKTLMDQIAKRS